MSDKGIVLEPGQVIVLAIDGTLVYVEAVTETYAAVVALPEQPPDRTDDRVFTPGKVGAKKISPFSVPSAVVPIVDVSARNKNFIGTYEKTREVNGIHFVDQTEEEKAAMSVKKVKPEKKAKVDRTAKREERLAARELRKAEKLAARVAASAPATCAACDAGHMITDTGVHYAGADESAPIWGVCAKILQQLGARQKAPKAAREPRQPRVAADTTAKSLQRFKLDPAKNLKIASALKDKFKAGCRGHKVYEGLRSLPSGTGTVAEVMTAIASQFGDDWCNDPETIVQRALLELSKPEFDSVTEKL